jgi:hypothetical protein
LSMRRSRMRWTATPIAATSPATDVTSSAFISIATAQPRARFFFARAARFFDERVDELVDELELGADDPAARCDCTTIGDQRTDIANTPRG